MTWTEKKFADVNGHRMAYVETGQLDGDPILFLHGNPTSSYLWRNIMPYMTDLGRCIAPDLIGMGDSDKLPDSGPDRYRFVEHQAYLTGLLDALGVTQNVTLVIHDWGSALGFDWANKHRDAVKGIAYMEAIVQSRSWDDFPERARPAFQAMRSPAGDKMVLEENFFVERMLPGSILRDLNDDEMAEYRRPFAQAGEARRPTLTWPRQIPNLAAADPHRRRARRRGRHRRRFRRLDRHRGRAQAVHRRRPGRHPVGRPEPRFLPHLDPPIGSPGQRLPLHPGRLPRRNRPRHRRLAARAGVAESGKAGRVMARHGRI
jgi:pimeloyl-ACP methyl ester carboxylesterase